MSELYSKSFTIEEQLPLGLVGWCTVAAENKVLCVGESADVFADFFQKKGLESRACESWENIQNKEDAKYDVILLLREIEKVTNPVEFLAKIKELLKTGGHIFISFENRFGLQFFCGDRDPYTNRIFDSIEGYQSYLKQDIEAFKGRLFSKAEVEKILDKAGLKNRKFYSILPSLTMPQQMFAEGYLPSEELAIRYTPMYHTPQTVFLNPSQLFDGLADNDMFHQMANAYLVDVTVDGEFDNATHITTSLDRGPELATATILRSDGTVEKKAIFEEGKSAIERLIENAKDLTSRGVRVVPVEPNAVNDGVVMPLINAPTATTYLREVFYSNRDKFLTEMDRFVDAIKMASPEPTGEVIEAGVVYRQIYPDMVPHNCFYIDGEFVFFDQEYCVENEPIGSVIVRAIDSVYLGDRYMTQELPPSVLYERYGVAQKANLLRDIGSRFVNSLRNADKLLEHRKKTWSDYAAISDNRLRMNYSKEEYNRLYEFPMKNAEGKKVFIFGTGSWAKTFLGRFSDYVTIEGALDNNEARWGETIAGVEIVQPTALESLNPEDYKVIICVKSCNMIMQQLDAIGVTNYSLYDPNIDWPEAQDFFAKKRLDYGAMEEESEAKSSENDSRDNADGIGHYNKGYVAGVFDLFHMGHVNVLRRAKEHCDYLIVGVVSDAQASHNKNRSPYVNEKDRLEIVRACKYVDEAFILPVNAAGSRDAYMRYHFDAQFSGSDYEKNPSWIQEQTWLREHGSDLVFFPYTESVSSTKLKEAIECEKKW